MISFNNTPKVNYKSAALAFIFCCTNGSHCKAVFAADKISYGINPLIKAIHQVESGGRLTEDKPILGDWCSTRKEYLSRGPLQISRAAHADALEHWPHIGGEYQDVDRLDYSISVFNAYQDRYATKKRVGIATPEIKSRIWNGGPNGHKKDATIPYWSKVQKWLK